MLANAEERLAGTFVELAGLFMKPAEVQERLDRLATVEAEIVEGPGFGSRVH
ncbi:MAG: hypothetical protein KA712_00125 [Myxococcales bacterium]|nr:hypothetical protein [Myxococcales bacterium]